MKTSKWVKCQAIIGGVSRHGKGPEAFSTGKKSLKHSLIIEVFSLAFNDQKKKGVQA
jgi:hypothetical protein